MGAREHGGRAPQPMHGHIASLVFSAVVAAGCTSVLGIEELPRPAPPGDGGAGTGGGGGSASVAAGGTETCEPVPDVSCHVWSRHFGNDVAQAARDATVDSHGNVVVSGCFQGRVDFGGQVLEAVGDYDGFIAEYDHDGALRWALRFGDEGSVYPCWYGVAVDADDNVLFGGSFGGTLELGDDTHISEGAYDVLVAKLSPEGVPIWSRRFGDADNQEVQTVAADSAGNVILVGSMTGTVDFGDGPRTSFDAEPDPFIAKLDANGDIVWSRAFANPQNDYAYAVAVDAADAIVVTGEAQAAVAWGGETLPPLGEMDVVVAKYAGDGTFVDSVRFGSPSEETAGRVLAAPDGDVVLAVVLGRDAVDFGGGPRFASDATVIVRLDAALHYRADRVLARTGVSDLAVASDGTLFAAAAIDDGADFGAGPVQSHGDKDAVLLELDAELSQAAALVLGGQGADRGRGVGVADDGAILFGNFAGTIYLGGQLVTSGDGSSDLLLVKYAR